MIPYTAYDVINAVNREVDLTRQPIREYQHSFGADGDQAPRDGQNGPGHPVSPGLVTRLTGLLRSLGRQSPSAQPTTSC